MNRYTRKIKRSKFPETVDVIILTAGIGAKVKSCEPRSLLKVNGTTLIEHQITVIQDLFPKSNIITVAGYDINKIIRKISTKTRIVENQIYQDSNSGESLRIGVNNSNADGLLILHGDLYFDSEIFEKVKFEESFLFCNNSFHEKEVGINIIDGYISVLSYGLDLKWSQIAFLRNNEVNILRRILIKNDFETKYLLSFEIINKIIENGGKFKAVHNEHNKIKELDTMKDIMNELINW